MVSWTRKMIGWPKDAVVLLGVLLFCFYCYPAQTSPPSPDDLNWRARAGNFYTNWQKPAASDNIARIQVLKSLLDKENALIVWILENPTSEVFVGEFHEAYAEYHGALQDALLEEAPSNRILYATLAAGVYNTQSPMATELLGEWEFVRPVLLRLAQSPAPVVSRRATKMLVRMLSERPHDLSARDLVRIRDIISVNSEDAEVSRVRAIAREQMGWRYWALSRYVLGLALLIILLLVISAVVKIPRRGRPRV